MSSGVQLRRRRHRDRRAEVGVVGDPHRDAALAGILDRVDDELLEPGLEVEVVEGEVERRLRARRGSRAAPARPSTGCWPPSVSVVTVIIPTWSLPTFCAAGRWCGTTPTSRSTGRPSSGSSRAAGRRRAAASARASRIVVVTEAETRPEDRRARATSRTTSSAGSSRGSRARRCTSSSRMREDDYHDRYRRAGQAREDGERDRVARALVVGGRGEGDDAPPPRRGRRGPRRRPLRPRRRRERRAARSCSGMPDDVEVVGVVTIGHAAPETTGRRLAPASSPWKPLEDVVRWEHW